MAQSGTCFLIILLACSSIHPAEKRNKRIRIADNQSPGAYLNIGTYFLSTADGDPHIPLVYEAFEKAALQEEDLEVRAKAGLMLGRFHYFAIGGFSDQEKMEYFLRLSSLAACQLPHQKEIIRMAQVLRQPKPFDVNQVNRRGESPLHYAAKKGYLELLKLLFLLGTQTIIEKELSGQTPLYLACVHGKTSAMEYLIEQGAQTDTRNSCGFHMNGWSLLHAAAYNNQKEALELLLNKGLQVSSHCDDFGLTAFFVAVKHGRLDAARIMLSHISYDAYVDEVDSNGWTCLHWAALRGEIETAQFLIRNGACVNAQTNLGDTPLHLAASGDHETMARVLIQVGADRTIENRAWKIPAQVNTTNMVMLAPDYTAPREQSPSL